VPCVLEVCCFGKQRGRPLQQVRPSRLQTAALFSPRECAYCGALRAPVCTDRKYTSCLAARQHHGGAACMAQRWLSTCTLERPAVLGPPGVDAACPLLQCCCCALLRLRAASMCQGTPADRR
jgi:hypothetical protein